MVAKGINKYSDKERRDVRRRNHAAFDLRTPKYRQKVVKKKDIKDHPWFDELDDDNGIFEDES